MKNLSLNQLSKFFWIEKLKLSILNKKLQREQLPKHLGLILDGNRRFAKTIGIPRKHGHAMGIKKFREVLGWCYELGIQYVTIWVFSSENWDRDPDEISDITDLFYQETEDQLKSGEFVKRGIRFRAIGDYSQFPSRLNSLLKELEQATEKGKNLTLNVSIGYGGRQEIVHAVNEALQVTKKNNLTVEDITQHTYLADQPNPDLIIRTSGEHRHSGFLLWHSPYSEYYFSPVFWPAITRVDFLEALVDYQGRHRRFGK